MGLAACQIRYDSAEGGIAGFVCFDLPSSPFGYFQIGTPLSKKQAAEDAKERRLEKLQALLKASLDRLKEIIDEDCAKTSLLSKIGQGCHAAC